ncbi:MAG: MlaD family protein, partial [Selenomonadaceae bacterium]
GTKITKKAQFVISSDGLMGEKFIDILPSAESSEEFLEPGAVVNGTSGRGMDYMMNKAGMTLEEMQKLVKSLNEIFGSDAVKQSLIQSAVNVKELTANMNQLAVTLQHMAVDNQQDVRTLVHNLSIMSASLVRAADSVETMVSDFSGDGKTAANLRIAVANLTSTSQRIENMAANLEPVIADPQTAADIKQILQNTKSVTARADNMMNRVGSIRTEGGAEFLYSGKDDRYMTNADLRIYGNSNEFLLLGVDDIGNGNKTNVQLGSGNDTAGYRAGIVDNEVGLGVDLKLGSPAQISLDAYDPNDVRLKLRGQYEISPDTYLVGQTNNLNKRDERATYVGIRRTF